MRRQSKNLKADFNTSHSDLMRDKLLREISDYERQLAELKLNGAQVNFTMIQNLILGKSVVPLSAKDYDFENTPTQAQLISKNESVKTEFYFALPDLWLLMQSVQQLQQNKRQSTY